jgi:tetratricopeptide (TPR) repeat protein
LTWLEAGDPETATLFFEHACRLQPETGTYLAMLLDATNRFDPVESRRLADEALEVPDRHDPIVVAFAAEVVLSAVPRLAQAEAFRLFTWLIPLLESTFHRIENGDTGEVDLPVLTKTCRLLGFCHESLGQDQAALHWYSRGIAADPSNHVLLVYRGILLYGASASASSDFELAIQYGSPVVWPYYFLAHYALAGGLFEQCRSLSERALVMEGSDTARSEVAEWLAIAQSALGYPTELIRQSFDLAIRFDPTNERARRNLATLESAARPLPASAYEMREKAAIRISGLSERRFRPAA